MTIIDLENISNADPAKDIGTFLAYLKWLEIRRSLTEEQTRTYGEAFLATYRPRIPSELKARIDFYYRSRLLSLACVISLQPKLRQLVESFLAEAGQAFPSVMAAFPGMEHP